MRTLESLAQPARSCWLAAQVHAQGHYGIGRPATDAEIAGWNIDIGRDGSNLPAGSGSVAHGHEVFEQQCAACHGAKAKAASVIAWSAARARSQRRSRCKTVGSYWPYAPTLFDYIRRAMPQNAPHSLSNDDVYAVSAYILNLNGLLRPMRPSMPGRSARSRCRTATGSPDDPRPDVKNPACKKAAEPRTISAVRPGGASSPIPRAAGAGRTSSS